MKNQVPTESMEKGVTPGKLMNLLEIKKSTYYNYVNYLGIKKTKDSSGQILISSEDAERIKALKNYVRKNGTRKGFLEEEGKIENQSINSSNGLALREDNQIARVITERIAKSDVEGCRSAENHTRISPDYEEIYVEPKKETNGFNPSDLIREAADLKTREIAMPDLIKRAIANNMEEGDLPVDLQEKLNLAREAANPKFTPESVASRLLANYRQKRLAD